MQERRIKLAAQLHPGRPFRLGLRIRGKIVLPYLILTLVIALVGTYVVINLVAGSLNERLDNHVLESGRAVLDALAQHEIRHIADLQLVIGTRGMAAALAGNQLDEVWRLSGPIATTLNVDCLIIVTAQGETVVHMLKTGDVLERVDLDFDPQDVWIINNLLKEGDPQAFPKRGIGSHPLDERYYYFTAIPVEWEDELAGVVMMGTTLSNLLINLKSQAMADIVIYQEAQAVETTLALAGDTADRRALLRELAMSPDLYGAALASDEATLYENVTVRGRAYRMVHAPLTVAGEKLALFAVALPSDFVLQRASTSRFNYAAISVAATVGVFFLGYVIAQRITNPIERLVRTSRAVAEGDLAQRTGIESSDEVGVLATAFDQMTERLEERTDALEVSLQTQRETASRMRSILSSIGDGVIWEDTQGNFVPLNGAAEEMLAVMAEHFLYGPMRDFPLAGGDQNVDEDNPWLMESRRVYVADKVYTVHSAAVKPDEETQLGTVIVIRDITLEVQAEQLKDAFVAHVSHELRTPLTSIKGYSSLLLSTAGAALNPNQQEFLNRIARHTDDLVAMINALLDFSEVEASGRLGLRLQPVDFGELIASVAKDWREKMQDKDLKFSLEIPGYVATISADAARLRWAVVNLIRNAHQYTPEGGRVWVRVDSREDRVILDVVDTGTGISLEDQRRLFSRFYRVMHTQDDDVRGLGLGLYVTRAIVEAHGGYIQVVSELDKGSTFTMVLPVRAREPLGE
ncbi:MAG: HAMP domain-containing protein [Anaerolineae bacterium]|nr:HAMP domain-containing protein [Anaerolineae bacterium]